jgi:hypothetical protein
MATVLRSTDIFKCCWCISIYVEYFRVNISCVKKMKTKHEKNLTGPSAQYVPPNAHCWNFFRLTKTLVILCSTLSIIDASISTLLMKIKKVFLFNKLSFKQNIQMCIFLPYQRT